MSDVPSFPFKSAPWTKDAACRGANPDIFFPERGESPREALKFCAVCPVTRPCLAYALEHNMSGVWGGTAGKQRKAIVRARDPRPPVLPSTPQCGTQAGYLAHRRRRDAVCDDCRAAERERGVQRRRLTLIDGGAA